MSRFLVLVSWAAVTSGVGIFNILDTEYASPSEGTYKLINKKETTLFLRCFHLYERNRTGMLWNSFIERITELFLQILIIPNLKSNYFCVVCIVSYFPPVAILALPMQLRSKWVLIYISWDFWINRDAFFRKSKWTLILI